MCADLSSTNNPEPKEQNNRSAHNPQTGSAGLSEDAALALLKSPNVTAEELALLGKAPVSSKSRKVIIGLVGHPRTPRHVSIPLLRNVFTFDLMKIALVPTIAPDIKRAAEEQIRARMEALPIGQKITLARRASGRVAAGLLQDSDRRVISTALNNGKLTEVLVVQALMKPRAPEVLFALASDHRGWSQRREIQIVLLRSENTPLERAKEFARNFSPEFLREIIPDLRIGLLTNPERE